MIPSGNAFLGSGEGPLAASVEMQALMASGPNLLFSTVRNARLLTRKAVAVVLSLGFEENKMSMALVNVATVLIPHRSHNALSFADCWMSSDDHLSKTNAFPGAIAAFLDSSSISLTKPGKKLGESSDDAIVARQLSTACLDRVSI